LLSHDEEFVPVGEKTGIHYEEDFDHYLSLLLKGNNWAINVITFYNRAVFGESQNRVDQPTASQADPATTWEDEFLRELEEDPLPVTSHGATTNNPVGTSSETPPDVASGSYFEPLTSISGTSDVHAGLDQLSLDGGSIPSVSAHCAPSSHRVTPIAAVPTQPPTSSTPTSVAPIASTPDQPEMVDTPVEPEPSKHVTRKGGRTTRAKK